MSLPGRNGSEGTTPCSLPELNTAVLKIIEIEWKFGRKFDAAMGNKIALLYLLLKVIGSDLQQQQQHVIFSFFLFVCVGQ